MSFDFSNVTTMTIPEGEVKKVERVSDGAVLWLKMVALSAVVSYTGTFTYTGSAQSPSWQNYDSSKIDISGDTSGTNAGNYSTSFTPKEGYCWPDGSRGAITLEWGIGKASVAIPSYTGTFTYTGSAQGPSWSGYDTNKMTMGGDVTGINAGSYTTTFTLGSNYVWGDGTTAVKSFTWTIEKASVTKPTTSSSFTYTGGVQTPTWSNYDANKMTKAGDASGTNAGSYTTTFTLKDTSNYKWSDNTTTTHSVTWSIAKAEGSLSISPTSITLNSDATSKTITVTRAGDGKISAVSNNTSVATVSVSGNTVTVKSVNNTTGSATITISVAAGTNHNAPSNKTCSVSASFVTYVLQYSDEAAHMFEETDEAVYYKSLSVNPATGEFVPSDPITKLITTYADEGLYSSYPYRKRTNTNTYFKFISYEGVVSADVVYRKFKVVYVSVATE